MVVMIVMLLLTTCLIGRMFLRMLRGVVTLSELVRARPDRRLEEIMNRDLITIAVESDQEDVARAFEHYDFIAMPVVDDERRLLGIITHDDILDVVQEEGTEDAKKLLAFIKEEFGWDVRADSGLGLKPVSIGVRQLVVKIVFVVLFIALW